MVEAAGSLGERMRAAGRPIVITGAGGWLGRTTLGLLDAIYGAALDDRVRAYGSRAREDRLDSGRTIRIHPLSEMCDVSGALVLHFAYLTKEQISVHGDDAFAARNREISQRVASACAGRGNALFIPSSGAARTADNAYGRMKRADERFFADLAHSGDLQSVAICRVFNIAGPYMNKIEHYVLGSIIADIQRGGPIVLKADRPVYRSYVHAGDLVTLALEMLLAPSAPLVGPFDTAGSEVVEVGELARRVRGVLDAEQIAIERPALSKQATEDRYVGDRAAFAGLVERYGIRERNLDAQIADTARFLGRTAPWSMRRPSRPPENGAM